MNSLRNLWRNVVYFGRFTLSFSRIGYLVRCLLWSGAPRNLKDQAILVTGGTAGIGEAAVLEALRAGAQVTAVGRSETKLEALKARAGSHGKNLKIEVCDLSSMEDTERFCTRLERAGETFDVVINNVGGLYHEHSTTAEGHETSYAVNLLNHRLLLENLIARDQLKPAARIINMASAGLYNAPRNTRRLDQQAKRFNGVMAYASHKRAQLALSDHYQERFAGRSWRFYTTHPGWTDTPGLQQSMASFRAGLRPILRSPAQGVDTALWLADTSPEPVEDKLWFDRKPRTAHAYAHTREPQASVAEVVAYLDKDIARFRGELPKENTASSGGDGAS